LETTKEGNLALIEIEKRIGDFQKTVRQMAQDYLAEKQRQGERYPYLDRGFDQRVTKYLESRDGKLFSKEEMANPKLLGAPYMPGTLQNKEQMHNWGRQWGLNTGDPVRTPDGRLTHLP
jgi:hypothetical protein